LLINVLSPTGARSFTRVRLQRQNDQLVALGNQYNYRFSVRPWSEQRNLVNRPELSYRSTGFNVYVDNHQDNGKPIFDKVVVTSAAESTAFAAELRPNVSLSYLSIFMNNQLTPTNNLRLAGKFMDPTTSGRPNRLSPSGSLSSELLVWFAHPQTGMDWDKSQLDEIPELTSWKAVFHLVNGDVETQYYETRTAPYTMPELDATRWAQLSTDTMSKFIEQTQATGSYALSGLTQYDVKWTVPERAQAPTEIQVQGYWFDGSARLRFNDVQSVSARADSGAVKCSAQGGTDRHCNGAAYAAVSYLDGLPLFALNRREVFLASQNFGYLLNGHFK
jgi:hypothetical protein